MNVLPKIESLFTFKDVWDVAGPFIITSIVIIIVGIISTIILRTMKRGLMKEIVKVLLVVGILFITYLSFQVTSFIWSQ